MPSLLREAMEPGPRTPGVRRAVQVLVFAAACLFLFRFGLPGIVLGGSFVAGGGAVTAKLDSETRFLSAIALGLGLAQLWLLRRVERYPGVLVFLSSVVVLGALSRVLSMAAFGAPAPQEAVATALEILIPTSIVFLLSRRAAGA